MRYMIGTRSMVTMSRGVIAPPAFPETTPEGIEMSMEELVNKLAELQAELKAEEAKADEASALTDASITDVKDKFRTAASLKIEDDTLVLTGLLDHTSVKDVAMNYVKGFNLTAVKKYMGVFELPMGAAELQHKTTVKLEVE
jgi:hypothetical protein